MEEKLKEILERAIEDNERLESKVEILRNKINFCSTHKFEEEVRIARIELNAIEMPSYKQGIVIKELQSLLNDWNS